VVFDSHPPGQPAASQYQPGQYQLPLGHGAFLSPGGYLLVLFAFRLSKAGYVVAGREVSIVISALIGSILLKEGRLPQRLLGAAIVASGVICVALAR